MSTRLDLALDKIELSFVDEDAWMLESSRSTGYEGVGIFLRVGDWGGPARGSCRKEHKDDTEQHVDLGIVMKFGDTSLDRE